MDDLDLKVRATAIQFAKELHPNRFNVAEKPSLGELLRNAKDIEEYLRTGEVSATLTPNE